MARFVVAPDGYGKTSVAIEYAETVFSWAHTLWVNCQSPCFMRDLDTGELASMITGSDELAQLVVFDDLPLLGPDRAELFSTAIDNLLGASCEVIACCVPACDGFALLQRDRLKVSATDLLLTDEEVDVGRTSDERLRNPAASMSAAHRVAALQWPDGSRNDIAFLKGIFNQPVPDEAMLAIVAMNVFTRGNIRDIQPCTTGDMQMLAELLAEYPHMCFDPDSGEFGAPVFAPADIAQALKGRFESIVGCSTFDTKDDLVLFWADSLASEQESAERACDIVRTLCKAGARPTWLYRHAFDLTRIGCFYGTLKLLGSMRTVVSKTRMEVRETASAIEAVCLHVLGDAEAAVKTVKRFAFEDVPPSDAHLCCLTIAARLATGTIRDKAIECLLETLESSSRSDAEPSFFEWMAQAQSACLGGPEVLGAFWERQRAAGAPDEALALTASWLFDAVDWKSDARGPNAAAQHGFRFDAVELYVRNLLEADDGRPLDHFTACAGLSMEQAHVDGMEYCAGPLSTPALLELRKAEMSLMSQRRAYEQDQRAEQVQRGNWAETHPDALLAGKDINLLPAEHRNIPTLHLKLFGRFEAFIGGVPLRNKSIAKSNTSTLAAILGVNLGREVMRDTLVQAMWPNSDFDLGKRNFYSVWSNLRKALMLPDGTCPYLLRRQYGCSFESDYVTSDAERFDTICHKLLFGKPDLQEWPALYEEIERDFSGDFMPGDMTNELLETARSTYRAQLIDALLGASQSLTDEGNAQWGIWFARSALARDHTREDAYFALMRAQIAADQRTAAMMTCVKCRHVLADELGMDMSATMSALYESLLNDL